MTHEGEINHNSLEKARQNNVNRKSREVLDAFGQEFRPNLRQILFAPGIYQEPHRRFETQIELESGGWFCLEITAPLGSSNRRLFTNIREGELTDQDRQRMGESKLDQAEFALLMLEEKVNRQNNSAQL